MQLPLQVTFRHMKASPTVESAIREKAAKLGKFADHIIGCRVVIETAGRHHEHGNQYAVRIDVTVPDDEIAVTREPGEHTEYRDLHVALRDAFDAARRQLEDYVRRKRRFVKLLDTAPHGRVARLFPNEDYGFLETPDKREIFFHRESVLNGGFNRLAIGREVAYVEEDGQKGPQASTVRCVGKHHHVAGVKG